MENTPETTTATKPYKRKTLLVNRKLQFRIMAYMTLVSAMSSLITSMSSFLIASLAERLSIGGSVTIIFVLSFAFVVAWTVLVLLFSNKIFGPIYRLHREIRNWRDGLPVQKIVLRKGDHLTEIIDDFNLIAEKFAPRG